VLVTDINDLLLPGPYDEALREDLMAQSDHSLLLDVLTQDPICPVCQIKGTPVSDDRGIAYRHEFRHYLCRVTPKALERT